MNKKVDGKCSTFHITDLFNILLSHFLPFNSYGLKILTCQIQN
jgi:hypothetical protein